MSIIGLSSYFLWTQKGATVLPLVRGSAFLLAFEQQHAFHHHHVVTASHVSCPVRHRALYGDSIGLKAIGERHLSTRLLIPHAETHRVAHSIPLVFAQHAMPSVDVSCLRVKDEKLLLQAGLVPYEVDPNPIEEGTPLIFCGVECAEERANPDDDALALHPRSMEGTCKAALVSLEYGTVILASVDGDQRGHAGTSVGGAHPLPLSMCGGPVLRASSGKCIGVTVARVLASAPPMDPVARTLYQDPYLDISENTQLHDLLPLDVAFVPIGEFHQFMRRTEV